MSERVVPFSPPAHNGMLTAEHYEPMSEGFLIRTWCGVKIDTRFPISFREDRVGKQFLDYEECLQVHFRVRVFHYGVQVEDSSSLHTYNTHSSQWVVGDSNPPLFRRLIGSKWVTIVVQGVGQSLKAKLEIPSGYSGFVDDKPPEPKCFVLPQALVVAIAEVGAG